MSGFIDEFNQRCLNKLEENLKYVKPEELGILLDAYKEKHNDSKVHPNKAVEQILLALPLWFLSRPKQKRNIDSLEYINFMTEINAQIRILANLIDEFVN